MKRILTLAVSLLAIPGTLLAADMPWAKDYASAQRSAAKGGKVVMIDFYTDWCTWCKRLDADTYTSPKVIGLTNKMVPLKLNAEKEGRALARKYGVNSFPTILFLDGAGNTVGMINGYLPAVPFAQNVDEIYGANRDYAKVKAALAKSPNDGKLNAQWASILNTRGQAPSAIDAALKAVKTSYRGPEMAKAYSLVADFNAEGGKYKEAAAGFAKAAELTTNGTDRAAAYVSTAICYLQLGQTNAAKVFAKKALATKGIGAKEQQFAQKVLASK